MSPHLPTIVMMNPGNSPRLLVTIEARHNAHNNQQVNKDSFLLW
jgi:hypothetical protein